VDKVYYKKLVWASVLTTILIAPLVATYQKFELGFNINTIGLVGTIAGANWLAWESFKKWIWKLPFFYGWLIKIPNLNGSWTGSLQSTWINNETGKKVKPIDTIVFIKQYLDKVTIDFNTNEMVSKSTIAEVCCDAHRSDAELLFIYQSEPKSTVRHRSGIHNGSAKLVYKVDSMGIEVLEGDYWTDRGTTGHITLWRDKLS
jgi:hypothetical protein